MNRTFLVLISICIIIGAPDRPAAQDVRSLLAETSGFSDDDLRQLDQGVVLVKSLPTTSKHEIATVGVVRLKDLPGVSMSVFRESFSQRSNAEVAAKGTFRELPSETDLSGFELEERDFSMLRKCIVADCDFNMSASWIRRFGAEVNWSANGHRQAATSLFRAMLLDNLNRYMEGGADALGEYANERKPVSIGETQRKLLTDTVILQRLSPELFAALEGFPTPGLAGLENEYYWSTIDFGFNPTVTLTHTAAYTSGDGSKYVAARQFYSSRYLDASLSLTMMVRGNDGAQYLIFTDRSSSDALGGIFHGVSSGVVANETRERIRSLLQKAELRLIGERTAGTGPANASATGELRPEANRFLPFAAFAILAVAVLAVVYAALRRFRK